MNLPFLKDANVSGKRVLLRVDSDVPLSVDGNIMDETRLKVSLPSIEYLLNQKATVIVCGHLGRPNGIVAHDLSLAPISQWYAQQFRIKNQESRIKETKIGDFAGWMIGENMYLLENLRFYKGEEEDDPDFAKRLASLADIYIDDAFAVSHRKAASNVGVAELLPHYAGMHFAKEIEMLSSVINNPARPLAVIIGGAKLETKLPLVKTMCGVADFVLVGGKIAQKKDEILKAFAQPQRGKIVIAPLNAQGTDVAEIGIERFLAFIAKAKTIVWNGPLGIIQNSELRIKNGNEDTEKGTRVIAEAVVNSGAHTVVGGGDSLDFFRRIGLLDKFSFVSTGGGAMLAFLSGEELPALAALQQSQP